MITITLGEAQRRTDRAFVMTSLAEIHTTWGEVAWNAGDYRTAVTHWKAAAKYRIAAKQEGA